MRNTKRAGFIYFAGSPEGGPIKIGWSSAPEHRLKGLLLWSPIDLVLLATAPGTLFDENFIHEQFRGQWRRCEWFEPSTSLTSLIEEIQRTSQLPQSLRAPVDWSMKRMPGHKLPGSSAGQRRVWAEMTPEQRRQRGASVRLGRLRTRAAA